MYLEKVDSPMPCIIIFSWSFRNLIGEEEGVVKINVFDLQKPLAKGSFLSNVSPLHMYHEGQKLVILSLVRTISCHSPPVQGHKICFCVRYTHLLLNWGKKIEIERGRARARAKERTCEYENMKDYFSSHTSTYK